MNTLTLEWIDRPECLRHALAIRREVFIAEQAVPEEIEIDEHDAAPLTSSRVRHALASILGNPAGTARMLLPSDQDQLVRVGRVAVRQPHRGQGLGTALMRFAQDEARGLGYSGVTVAAQVIVRDFYERLGYVPRGEVFVEADIDHLWMDLRFDGDRGSRE
ncbi:GNAT family N-acetyltransferase [Planctomycetes bacterium Pan216]